MQKKKTQEKLSQIFTIFIQINWEHVVCSKTFILKIYIGTTFLCCILYSILDCDLFEFIVASGEYETTCHVTICQK
jgi:hypothetical protein